MIKKNQLAKAATLELNIPSLYYSQQKLSGHDDKARGLKMNYCTGDVKKQQFMGIDINCVYQMQKKEV